jgi:hypothetical protein
MEVVEHTSETQWDALLEVAEASAKLDRRRGDLDTSDEEEEEAAANNFINDDQSEDARCVTLLTCRYPSSLATLYIFKVADTRFSG